MKYVYETNFHFAKTFVYKWAVYTIFSSNKNVSISAQFLNWIEFDGLKYASKYASQIFSKHESES